MHLPPSCRNVSIIRENYRLYQSIAVSVHQCIVHNFFPCSSWISWSSSILNSTTAFQIKQNATNGHPPNPTYRSALWFELKFRFSHLIFNLDIQSYCSYLLLTGELSQQAGPISCIRGERTEIPRTAVAHATHRFACFRSELDHAN